MIALRMTGGRMTEGGSPARRCRSTAQRPDRDRSGDAGASGEPPGHGGEGRVPIAPARNKGQMARAGRPRERGDRRRAAGPCSAHSAVAHGHPFSSNRCGRLTGGLSKLADSPAGHVPASVCRRRLATGVKVGKCSSLHTRDIALTGNDGRHKRGPRSSPPRCALARARPPLRDRPDRPRRSGPTPVPRGCHKYAGLLLSIGARKIAVTDPARGRPHMARCTLVVARAASSRRARKGCGSREENVRSVCALPAARRRIATLRYSAGEVLRTADPT